MITIPCKEVALSHMTARQSQVEGSVFTGWGCVAAGMQ